ncbi:hypothetical protein HMPREF3213_02058 [Heyndrickxia coagulans]|uniref:Uncharacterized protein n=1 Tax=Heyndrickxia coagulans TaxID=1398 RepID=A0A0C5C5V6_HEYCO|nr:hypothetical protein SB48_HM08orf01909 [Heyndrickxia coagulans]KWZ81322.1 hypothetical protein HMPREF3213_02058 [Heyndrickxia coagulans]
MEPLILSFIQLMKDNSGYGSIDFVLHSVYEGHFAVLGFEICLSSD